MYRIYKIKTPNTFMIYLSFVIFKREILTDVYRAEVTFLIPIEEFSLVLLFCVLLLVTVLFIYFCFKRQE